MMMTFSMGLPIVGQAGHATRAAIRPFDCAPRTAQSIRIVPARGQTAGGPTWRCNDIVLEKAKRRCHGALSAHRPRRRRSARSALECGEASPLCPAAAWRIVRMRAISRITGRHCDCPKHTPHRVSSGAGSLAAMKRWSDRMRRVCLKFLVAVLVLAVASCNRSGAPERAKKIEHRTQTFDFGEARQGSVVHHTFRVANAGPQPMTVSKVQTSCGCTVATVKAGAVIGPGESLDVPVDLSLQGKKNPIESSVVVNYADGAVPDQLVLKGKVGEEYPGTVAFPDIKRGDRPEQVVTLSTYPGQPALEIKEIVNDAAKFDVTSRPGTKDGAVDIVVKPATNIAYGPVSDKLIVKTNDAGAPDKLIAVRAKVAKLLEPARRTMIIHPNKDGGPVTAVAEFTSTYGLPITDAVASISREKRFSAALEP
ncbi:MAG: DUF1573 domain-containing protein, partial [Candidatus Hydrogenedentes bacterium]|nr:DUF1573 domain-containing protein [Candidatus Hydrogenedentota bacterium]